ncbi:sugar transport protein 2-like isoform X3 [Drosophila innubila]|uniref:sugar transport protein 2-like isoform X3 n=1 Tax=Drosophila innubila TaxID=198719 RepID=UPI00148C6B59|nr:sugar transport protein 2-like isoform X3 [Drosophila innubila]
MQNDKFMPPEAPTHGYPAQGEPQHGYPQQGYPQQGYPQQGYPPQGYPQPTYPAQNYAPPPQGFNPPPPQHYGPPPQIYVPPPPPLQTLPQATVVVASNQRSKPQSNAVGAAALIFMSGGMNIAWSVGFRSFAYALVPQHTYVAWFIAVIIGAVISFFLTNKVPKKIVLVVSSLLVLIAGITRAATRYNLQAVEACLYLDGIANGLTFAPAMALAGEIAVSYKRGSITASVEHMSYTLGFFIQIVYTESWTEGNAYYYNSFTSDQMHGVLSAIYGLIALIIAALFCIESPVIMLANGHEQQAIEALRRLQRPNIITTETYAQLEEHKRYLAQNKNLSTNDSIIQGLPALIRLIYLRVLSAMSLSTFVYYAVVISMVPNLTFRFYWEFLVFGACRCVATLITSLCMESAGRKKPTLLGLLVCGGFAFGIGNLISGIPYGPIDTIFYLICIFQIFAGIAFTASSAYLSEAFPLGVKQHYIGFTLIAEMLVFIIIACVKYSKEGHAIFFYFFGVLSVIGFVVGIFCLPETRRTTLREAQDKFKGIISRAF